MFAAVKNNYKLLVYVHLCPFIYFVIDEIVVEVWQLKSIPRGLLDVNELDICLSVYNEAFMECL